MVHYTYCNHGTLTIDQSAAPYFTLLIASCFCQFSILIILSCATALRSYTPAVQLRRTRHFTLPLGDLFHSLLYYSVYITLSIPPWTSPLPLYLLQTAPLPLYLLQNKLNIIHFSTMLGRWHTSLLSSWSTLGSAGTWRRNSFTS